MSELCHDDDIVEERVVSSLPDNPVVKSPPEKLSVDNRGVRALALRFAVVYKSCALMLFNILVLFVVVNLALSAVIGARNALVQKPRAANDPVSQRYTDDVLDKVYPGVDRRQRQAMLTELWNRTLAYSDFNHFRARPIEGRYVNVTQAGYRKSAKQGPWPPAPENLTVFAFGGSTCFGHGVPDDETVPSHLQHALAAHSQKRVCVYNFGVAFYYSTQDRFCLEKLLIEGHVPDIAIFIDGINEGTHLHNRPTYSHEMAAAFEQLLANRAVIDDESYWQAIADTMLFQLPIGRLAEYMNRRLKAVDDQKPVVQEWRGPESSRRVCETYFANKYLIEELCGRYGVTPVFIWQPSPAYNYDLRHHPFAPSSSESPQRKYHFAIMRDYYPAMRELHDQRAEQNFLWCADIQLNRAEALYCDRYHYTAAFSKDLADYICKLCLERKLLDRQLQR
jgi:hypothetical protein